MKKRAALFLILCAAASLLQGKTLLAEEAGMHSLIQTTTLEGDYQALTSLGLMNTPLSEEENIQSAYENVCPSMVRIQVDGHYGSGSIYKMLEEEIIIVTNRHVLQYFDEDSYVTFFNGRVGNGRLLGTSEEADIGFISIPIAGFTYEELLEFRNVRSSSKIFENLKENTCFFMVDMATDRIDPVYYEGKIIDPFRFLSDFGTEMLYGEGYAKPGMSGCGMFDAYGNYIGMLAGGTLQDEIAGVPAGMIEQAYQEIVIIK